MITGILHTEEETITRYVFARLPPRQHGFVFMGLPQVH